MGQIKSAHPTSIVNHDHAVSMSVLAVCTLRTALGVHVARLGHLTAEHIERATDGDTVTATVNLENGQKGLGDTAETLSGDKTSGESVSPHLI